MLHMIRSLSRSCMVVALLLTAAAQGQTAPGPLPGWKEVKHVNHGLNYGVVRHNGSCVVGRIAKVSDDAITIQTTAGSKVTVAAKDVLRVEDGDHIYDVIYTARSSWHDVKGMSYNEGEWLVVKTRDGQQHRGHFIEASDSELKLTKVKWAKDAPVFTLPKSDIFSVDYDRIKPVSSDTEYFVHEGLGWMKPEMWPRYLGIGDRMTVSIYDASQPEDNSPLPCREDPRNQ